MSSWVIKLMYETKRGPHLGLINNIEQVLLEILFMRVPYTEQGPLYIYIYIKEQCEVGSISQSFS